MIDMILLNLICYRLKHIETYWNLIDIDPIKGILLQTHMAIFGNIWQWNFRFFKTYCSKLWQAMQAQETSWIIFVDARPIHHYLARSRKPFWCFSAVSTMSAAMCAALCAALCSTAGWNSFHVIIHCYHCLEMSVLFFGVRVILWDWLFEDWAMK